MSIEVLLFGGLIIFVVWMWDVSLYSNVTGWFPNPEEIPFTKSIVYLVNEIIDFWKFYINWGNLLCRILIYFVVGLQVAVGVIGFAILKVLKSIFSIIFSIVWKSLSAILRKQ